MKTRALLLTGVATLSMLGASAAHATTLPDTITGNWCFAEDSMEGEDAQILIRDCDAEDDGVINIAQNGIKGEGLIGGGSCTFERIEQINPDNFLIHTHCADKTGGLTKFEIVDGRLFIRSLPEG